MVYTCGKCTRSMHDDEPHFRMYHRDDGYGNADSESSVTIIECPSCGALYVSEHLDVPGVQYGVIRDLVNWHSSNPFRPLVERARFFIQDHKRFVPHKIRKKVWWL